MQCIYDIIQLIEPVTTLRMSDRGNICLPRSAGCDALRKIPPLPEPTGLTLHLQHSFNRGSSVDFRCTIHGLSAFGVTPALTASSGYTNSRIPTNGLQR